MYSPSAASTIYKGNYDTVDSSAVGFGNNYEADKKTMGNGHLDFAGQNTAWGRARQFTRNSATRSSRTGC